MSHHDVPTVGDAIRARSSTSGRWMGGVVSAVDPARGFVWLVAGRYDLGSGSQGVRCSLYRSETVHVGRSYVEIYRDAGLTLCEEHKR
jgi:hypothetical protein